MTALTETLQAFTAFALVATACVFIFQPKAARSALKPFPFGTTARLVLAAAALLAGVAMGISIAVPFFAFFAAVFAALLGMAIGLFLLTRGARRLAGLSAAIVVAALLVGVLQPLGLKVALLPKADVLPYEPVIASVVKTYDEGVWFESVRAGADGVLYLAANIGLDFNRTDYYHDAHGEVIARQPDGSERTMFTTPVGSAAGALAVAADGMLYMSSNGATPGIWRISQDGHGEVLARLPEGAWPNGLDFGPDRNLYSPDSSLGLVWRIDPRTGDASPAVRDPSLSARPFIALAPGANGLRFKGRDMIVTVSDSTKTLRFTMDDAGKFSAPEVLASGIPGDDFAIGSDGSLFITTHPYDTLVKVAADGRRSIIADAHDRIIGATDATFGKTDADRDVLYVATDGGAFTGGPHTRGQLLALRPYAPR